MKIIGLRINKVPLTKYLKATPSELDYNDELVEEFEFIYETNKGIYSRKFFLEHGMCYSGYCGSEWIHENSETTEFESREDVGPLHYVPKGNLNLEYFHTEYDGNEYFTFYEGTDSYYPSATLDIKFDMWIETKRAKAKKQVYIFAGPSAIGKSFIAGSSSLNVYETDSSNELMMTLDNDIVVLGNKYPYLTSDIQDYYDLKYKGLVELILVGFKKYE